MKTHRRKEAPSLFDSGRQEYGKCPDRDNGEGDSGKREPWLRHGLLSALGNSNAPYRDVRANGFRFQMEVRETSMDSLYKDGLIRRVGVRVGLTIAFISLLLLAGAAPSRAAANDDKSQGKVTSLMLPTQLVRPYKRIAKREVLIYLPAGYDAPQNRERRYSVLYLLHGSPGNPYNFLNLGHWPERMEAEARNGACQQAILVMPDGNYAGEKHGDSEWANSADRRDRFEDWVVQEIVPYMDSHYRTRPDRAGRFLAGVSEGGFGAINLALHNPGVFGGAIGLSGYYDMRGFGWGHIIMDDSDGLMALNSPLFYVPEKTERGRVPAEWRTLRLFMGAGATETPYAEETRTLGERLGAAGISGVTVQTPKGKHDWGLWSSLFVSGLHTVLSLAEAVASSR
jgi:S-formylglutathione hydrolase FrmB